MTCFGSNIIALHDPQAMTIQFNALFTGQKFSAIGATWVASVRDRYGEIVQEASDYISINNSGLLSYSPMLETYYYIYVTAQRYTEGNFAVSEITFSFRLSDVMG